VCVLALLRERTYKRNVSAKTEEKEKCKESFNRNLGKGKIQGNFQLKLKEANIQRSFQLKLRENKNTGNVLVETEEKEKYKDRFS
jgi:hypothetical protein